MVVGLYIGILPDPRTADGTKVKVKRPKTRKIRSRAMVDTEWTDSPMWIILKVRPPNGK